VEPKYLLENVDCWLHLFLKVEIFKNDILYKMALTLPTRFFPTTPGRAAFGVNKPVLNAGDYVLNKKAKNTYCNISVCKPANILVNQSDLLLLKKSNYLYNKCRSYNFNNAQLNVNLFTKMDLTGVNVISDFKTGISPTPIIPLSTSAQPTNNSATLSVNPYFVLYKSDPCGELFGNNTCGINNYQNFVTYNPPYKANVVNTNLYNCPIIN